VGLLDVGVGNDDVLIGLRVVGLNDDGCTVDGFRDLGLAVGFVDGLDVGLVVGLNLANLLKFLSKHVHLF
jgi:hypothetical protein